MSAESKMIEMAVPSFYPEAAPAKPQKPKAMRFKVGQALYRCSIDDDGKVELTTWIIRSIRKGRAFATEKNEWTWKKLSKKNGDWGWAKTIPSWLKQSFVGDPDNASLYTTKLAAIRKELRDIRSGHAARYHEDEALARALPTLKRMETLNRPKKKL